MGRPPKNATDNQDFILNEFEIKELQKRNEDLEKQNENLLIENKNLSKTIDFLKQEKTIGDKNGVLITADHSIHYNKNTYLPGQVIENPPESDINELLKFGELV